MRKIKLIVSYDGTDFHGFQKQAMTRTVQGTLEQALSRLTNEEIQVNGSGRTDAGVHALGQVCHFTTNSSIPVEKYPLLLVNQLPRDIVVCSSREVEMDFHARKSAYWKTYRYQIDTNAIPDMVRRRFQTHFPYGLDHELMQEAGNYLVGTYDFTSFCSTKTNIMNRVRTIYRCHIQRKSGIICIEVTGSGFLYHMIRIIVGTLVEVGRKRMKPEGIQDILLSCDRKKAGVTFPPEGLQLVEVGYEPWNRKINT